MFRRPYARHNRGRVSRALGPSGPQVSITSPAEGTQFIVGEAQSVSITSDTDGTYEVTFDGTNARGTIVVSGGSGSGNVTADWADGIASPELTSFRVRLQGESQTLATRACTIFTGPEAAIQDGTVVLAYDAERNATTGSGLITALAPVVGGTAADTLVPITNPPTYGAVAALGGRKASQGDGEADIGSTTPASAVTQAQPNQRIFVGVPPSNSPSGLRWFASAATSFRQTVWHNSTYQVFAGSTVSTGLTPVAAGAILIVDFNGSSSDIEETALADGAQQNQTISPGAESVRGTTWHANFDGSLRSNSIITAELLTTGLSSADRTRLYEWANLTAARGGCGAGIPL